MNTEQNNILENLVAKEEIRELALLYSRGVDRQDIELLRTLYTSDATDTHGDTFDGGAKAYCDFLEKSFPYMKYSGHHVCNHLISVDGNEAEGEVYAIAIHLIPDGQGGYLEDLMCVRYVDNYRKEEDGYWRFSKRIVTYDFNSRRPVAEESVKGLPARDQDPTYVQLTQRLFNHGKRF